jgi:hypothetical protein
VGRRGGQGLLGQVHLCVFGRARVRARARACSCACACELACLRAPQWGPTRITVSARACVRAWVAEMVRACQR